MKSQRQQKVEGIIQADLAEIIPSKINTHGSLVTISQVDVTPDLSIAKVYVSIFPADKREVVFNEITSHNALIRKNLGNKLAKVMRIIPELQFKLDTSLDTAEQVDKELKGKGDNPIL